MPAFFSTGCETLSDRAARSGRANGFDALRLVLALGIVAVHSFALSQGGSAQMYAPLRALGQMILPSFFAVSGYLVTSSLLRCDGLRTFLALRLLRILPALALVTLLTALVLGPLFSTMPLHVYLAHPDVPRYLQNAMALPQFHLPGLFETNPRAGIVNGSLWSIQIELTCYLLLAMLAVIFRNRLAVALTALALLLLFPLTPFAGELLAWLPAKELVLAFTAGALLQVGAARVPAHSALGAACLLLVFTMATVQGFAPWLCLPLAYGVIWLAMRRLPSWLTRHDYSYGVYLTAYPLQQLHRDILPSQGWAANLLFALPLALLCAMALWHGLERPLLSRRQEIVTRLTGDQTWVRT